MFILIVEPQHLGTLRKIENTALFFYKYLEIELYEKKGELFFILVSYKIFMIN